MNRLALSVLTLFLPTLALATSALGDDSGKSLLGGWAAQSIESDGKKAPDEAAKAMQFTFKADKLLIKGNTGDGKEEACTYKIVATATPKRLDFTPPGQQKPVLAIYELDGDTLRICFRHGSAPGGRPTEFKTAAGAKLVLVEFKRQAE